MAPSDRDPLARSPATGQMAEVAADGGTVERRRLYEALAERDRRDPLTGALSRPHFVDRLGETLLRARAAGVGLSVLVVDLDHFRDLNAAHGLAAGDAVLRDRVTVMTRALRSHDLACRFDGDVLAVALPGAIEDNAVMVAERIRRAFAAQVIDWQGVALRVTASMGIACMDGECSVDDLLVRAERARTEAKRQGRNRVMTWRPAMQEEVYSGVGRPLSVT